MAALTVMKKRRELVENQFPTEGKYDFAIVHADDIDIADVAPITYAAMKKDGSSGSKNLDYHRFWLNFHCEDYLWQKPLRQIERYIQLFKKLRFVTSFDISVWTDMPRYQQISHLGKRRYMDAVMQANGIKVVPSVACCDKRLLEIACDGIPMRGIVEVSTHGAKSNKSNFLNFFDFLCSNREPETVLCYGKPFKEMLQLHKNIIDFTPEVQTLAKTRQTSLKAMNQLVAI